MKKIISLILAGLMSLSLCTNAAFAADPSVTITSRDHNATTGIVTVNGQVDNARDALPLVLTVANPSNDIIFADYATVDSTFTFSSFRFLESMPQGAYTFTVYAEYINKTATFTLNHIPSGAWLSIINGAVADKASYNSGATDSAKQAVLDGAVAALDTNIVYTNEDPAVYAGLSTAAKELIALSVMNGHYPSLPSVWPSSPTSGEITALSNAINAYKAACTDGMRFAQLYDSFVSGDTAGSKTAFDAWYAANKSALGLEADNGATAALNENTFMTTVFPTSYNADSFYNKLPAAAKAAVSVVDTAGDATSATTSALRAKAAQKGIVDACILSKVDETTSGNVVGTFLETYASYIGINYGSANATQKGTAHDAVAGKTYATLSALSTAVENAIPTGTTPPGPGTQQGSGSPTTSVGGNPGVVTGVVNNGTGAPLNSDEAPFEDLEGYEWAKEAIDFLYRRSIISGRDEKTYDPAGLVTRAEFIKMLVATYNFAVEDYSDYKFNDISGGEWYAIFVKKAAAMGIVTGDENGNFNPQSSITRQDMAVTVYRASKFPDSTEPLDFVDNAEISDYAKSAVASLYEKGVVSGMGDMVFAPKQNVNRAQAAQILYNVLAETIK